MRRQWNRAVLAILGAFFLASALLKVIDASQVSALTHVLGTGRTLDLLPAALVGVEFIIGAALCLSALDGGPAPQVPALSAMAFLVSMIFVMAALRTLGISGDCGCMGPVKLSLGWAVARNLVMVVALLSVVAAVPEPERRALPSLQRIAILVPAVALAITTWTHVSNTRQALTDIGRDRLLLQVSATCPHCHELLKLLAEHPAAAANLAIIGDVRPGDIPAGATHYSGVRPFMPMSPSLLDFRGGGAKAVMGGAPILRVLRLAQGPQQRVILAQ